jgi:hypothetical protein
MMESKEDLFSCRVALVLSGGDAEIAVRGMPCSRPDSSILSPGLPKRMREKSLETESTEES